MNVMLGLVNLTNLTNIDLELDLESIGSSFNIWSSVRIDCGENLRS